MVERFFFGKRLKISTLATIRCNKRCHENMQHTSAILRGGQAANAVPQSFLAGTPKNPIVANGVLQYKNV